MNARFYWLQTLTSVHVGAGRTGSLVDLPVIRESTTNYPFIPGSGLKGALRDEFRLREARNTYNKKRDQFEAEADQRTKKGENISAWEVAVEEADTAKDVGFLFGQQESAGQLLIGDARLAFIPMRALEFAFVWVTSPLALWRLSRDFDFAGVKRNIDLSALQGLNGKTGSEALFTGTTVHVEDYRLENAAPGSGFNAKTYFKDFFPHPYHKSQLHPNDVSAYENIVIVNDLFFSYLVSRRLPVRTRNRLEPVSKTVITGALWSEESLPPETVMYSVFCDRSAGEKAFECFDKPKIDRLQIGGNESVGEGWVSLQEELSK